MLVYECLGTATLMAAVLLSAGDAVVVVMTLWAILMICGGITGGHFNPAVTTGVYVWRGKFKEDLRLYLMIMVWQFVGAAIGCVFSWLLIGTFTPEWHAYNPAGAVKDEWVPHFAPWDPLTAHGHAVTNRAWSTFIIQVVCTGVFVFIILINKSTKEVQPSQ